MLIFVIGFIMELLKWARAIWLSMEQSLRKDGREGWKPSLDGDFGKSLVDFGGKTLAFCFLLQL